MGDSDASHRFGPRTAFRRRIRRRTCGDRPGHRFGVKSRCLWVSTFWSSVTRAEMAAGRDRVGNFARMPTSAAQIDDYVTAAYTSWRLQELLRCRGLPAVSRLPGTLQ